MFRSSHPTTHHSIRVQMAIEKDVGRETVTKIADPMAVPLIVINTLIIVYALVLG